jgi:hypothetical protein
MNANLATFQNWIQALSPKDRKAIAPYIPQLVNLFDLPSSGISTDLDRAEFRERLQRIQQKLPAHLSNNLELSLFPTFQETAPLRSPQKLHYQYNFSGTNTLSYQFSRPTVCSVQLQ